MENYRYTINPHTGRLQKVLSDDYIQSIATSLNFKEGVATIGNLPPSGNVINDARFVNDTHHLYVWNGSSWQDQGDIIDLTWGALENKPTSIVGDIDDAVAKKHDKLHSINDIINHIGISGTGIEDNFMAIDANGLPKDSGKSASDFGDMLKSIYDIGDNGIVDKAEALNDGSTGGGNNVTASEARSHIDDITTNPHNITPETIGETDWFQSFILNTPSRVTNLFGKSSNGFPVDNDIRLEKLYVQYYSEHPTQSALRVRVYRYDANATTDREILSIIESATATGYHNPVDNTPDTTYYIVDASAGDTLWIEIDDGAGNPASRVRDITISVKYTKV